MSGRTGGEATSSDSTDETPTARRPRSGSVSGLLRESVARVVADPWLALPFIVAGVVLTAIDWLRVRDPVPVLITDLVGDVTISIPFRSYPSGLRMTGVRPAALVDLELGYLSWIVGVELVALLAVGVAGWLTLSRATATERSGERLVSYLGLVIILRVLFRFFAIFDGLGWFALVGVVAFVVVSVRLFATPVLVVTGSGVREATRQSARRSVGEGTTVFGLLLVVGLSVWLLGSIPVAGAFFSTAVVAPIHGVAAVVFVESTAP